AGRCSVGDVLGVVDGDFAVIGSDLTEVAADVLSRLLSGGGELVTLVTGQDCPPSSTTTSTSRRWSSTRAVRTSVRSAGQS
ncbi:MAG TPA: hypothetical protein VFD41_13410, partial [Actinomycetales bacterium]|nr:hypothetical protein [Actinomycetales bacterium]